jgi:uncharacterized protein DUF4389
LSESQPPGQPPPNESPPEHPPPSDSTPEAPQRPEAQEPPQPPEGTPPGAVPLAYEPPPPHPVRLVVYDDLKRSRLTVFFRLLLLIPHYVWQWAWVIGIMPFCVFVNWFAVLFRGSSPEDLHLLLARMLRYFTHYSSYLYLASNPYPTFFGRPGTHPNDLEVEGPERQRRVITIFRLILAIPAFVIAYVFSLVMFFVAFIGWFIALVIGRMPKGMRDLAAYCLQYIAQTYAYLMILTDRYPSFSGPRS